MCLAKMYSLLIMDAHADMCLCSGIHIQHTYTHCEGLHLKCLPKVSYDQRWSSGKWLDHQCIYSTGKLIGERAVGKRQMWPECALVSALPISLCFQLLWSKHLSFALSSCHEFCACESVIYGLYLTLRSVRYFVSEANN